ncbi:MAG: D-alanyl-lipoteichoic acid biosynthesis protein DltD [Oscillospiraceae bacterium]|nr:D-alanyl-lipoteichoic acid biosynthesis protein DltD [Oscillospiraceae bacterium]
MKKFLLRALCLLVISALLFSALPFAIKSAMPEYNEALGNTSDDQKIQGLYLLKESASLSDNVIIYGSSELRTDYISTHPANFFAGKRSGFQVNLIGRGSCQSIIHAMSIAASGDSLEDRPVVLITSPQSFVEGGITPDMFFANFSKQQYISIMYDSSVSDDIKKRLSLRVCEMLERYDEEFGRLSGYDDIRLLASAGAKDGFVGNVSKTVTAPYFLFERVMLSSRDMIKSAELINGCEEQNESELSANINWELEEKIAAGVAKKETTNNDFGMRDSDYKKNVGNKLSKFENRDKDLSYENSVEYDDLQLLLDICVEKGIKPLVVGVPLHGQWSDYTGFTKERRQAYYDKLEGYVALYCAMHNFEFLDLSEYEYEKYFLCDTMHLGWKGWLRVNEEIDAYYHRYFYQPF